MDFTPTPVEQALASSQPSAPVDWVAKLKETNQELRVTGEDNEANPTLEIALLMDCTSSMSSWITKAKETLNEIIDKVVEECKEEGNLQVRVSFVGYRDIKDKVRFTVKPFTSNVNEMREFIQCTKAQGGADLPEDLQGGLKIALLQDWTEEAAKRVFLICDAPCHGKKYHDTMDDFPEGSPEGLNLESMMSEFCKKEIEFQVIKLDRNCDKMIEIMKSCHQELEVTDMSGMKQVMGLRGPPGPPPGGAAPMMGAPLGGPPMMGAPMMGAPMMQAQMAPPMMGMGAPMMQAQMAPPNMGAPMMQSQMAAPMMGASTMMGPPQMMMEAPKDESRDYFQSQAIQSLSGQVQRKQAAVRSKKK